MGQEKIKEILHTGADFTERYHYDYDVMGNKVLAEKRDRDCRKTVETFPMIMMH